MPRVLITGIDGFTGDYLSAALGEQGYEVHGVVRGDPEAPLHYKADLRDAEALADIVKRVRPHKVFHFAAISHVEGNVDNIYAINVVGTRNLLEALARSKSQPDAVLVASSANVYGNRIAGRIDENTPPAPVNDYGVSKLAAEYVAHIYAPRIPIIICRPFNYTGVGQGPDFIIPKIVDHARRRAEAIQLGNIDVARDFSDVRVVTDIYCRLIEASSAIGQTINICSGEAHTLEAILSMIGELSGHRLNVTVNPSLVRQNEVRSLWGDRRKLDSIIGNQNMIPLRDTLQWMLEA